MFIDIMGAKYPPPMGPILESSVAGEKRVLDLGAGNGAWYVPLDRFNRGRPQMTNPFTFTRLRDVCRDWPLCDALAVDLVPLKECVPHLWLTGFLRPLLTHPRSVTHLPPNFRCVQTRCHSTPGNNWSSQE